jgi:hypothetical protein
MFDDVTSRSQGPNAYDATITESSLSAPEVPPSALPTQVCAIAQLHSDTRQPFKQLQCCTTTVGQRTSAGLFLLRSSLQAPVVVIELQFVCGAPAAVNCSRCRWQRHTSRLRSHITARASCLGGVAASGGGRRGGAGADIGGWQ